jgi:RNA polymerase sigma-70 factor (ECF subfamily)
MEKQSDEYYIREILNGDTGSFSALVEKYQHLAFSLSMKIIGNREEAEDAAQESFIKAYNSLPFFNRKSTFRTWFFRIVYNTAISGQRAQNKPVYKIEDIRIPESELTATETTMNNFQTADRTKYLKMGLERLEPDEQVLLNLYYYDEMSMEEIAGIMGLTQSNVKVKIFRSRKHLLSELNRILKDEIISIL